MSKLLEAMNRADKVDEDLEREFGVWRPEKGLPRVQSAMDCYDDVEVPFTINGETFYHDKLRWPHSNQSDAIGECSCCYFYGGTITNPRKVALVTGSSGNLGPIWVRCLEELGFEIVNFDLPIRDITFQGHINRSLNALRGVGKVPSVIVHNAGVDVPPGGQSGFWDNYLKILAVNLIGAVQLTRAFLPDMIANGGGVMTYIGSWLAFEVSDPDIYPPEFDKPWAYPASKAGLWTFVRNCNTRWAKDGMVFNMLMLSGVEGKQNDEFKEKYGSKVSIGRMLRPEDFINEFKCCVNAKVPYDQPLMVTGGRK